MSSVLLCSVLHLIKYLFYYCKSKSETSLSLTLETISDLSFCIVKCENLFLFTDFSVTRSLKPLLEFE